jgi:hypothetical protein
MWQISSYDILLLSCVVKSPCSHHDSIIYLSSSSWFDRSNDGDRHALYNILSSPTTVAESIAKIIIIIKTYECARVGMCVVGMCGRARVCVCVWREKYIDPGGGGGGHFVTTLVHTRAFPNTHTHTHTRRRRRHEDDDVKRFSGGGELEKTSRRKRFPFSGPHTARNIYIYDKARRDIIV